MTNSNIKNYEKVCRVGAVISQVCQIQKLDWLEKEFLNQWWKAVLKKQDEDEEISFILSKYAFLDYLRSDENCMSNEPITPFLVDTIQYLF